MDGYVLIYCTTGSPARPKGQKGPNQEYHFHVEGDSAARSHVRIFCQKPRSGTSIKRKPRRLFKVISLK
jgi:hypothetical protein